MGILIYRRQRVEYEKQNYTTCLVPQFTFYVMGPSEFFATKDLKGTIKNYVPRRSSSKGCPHILSLPRSETNGRFVL